MKEQLNRLQDISHAIGNTPLLEISLLYKGKLQKVYAKAEYYNLTGSIKDRAAFYMLKRAYEQGKIHEKDTIAEATSGNMGIAFCALGAYLGNPVVIYMPDWMSNERKSLIRSYGAEIRLVSRENGGFLGCIELCKQLAKDGGVFLPCQFENEDNSLSHYFLTAKEAATQLESIGAKVDAVVAGVGTGGTIMGLGRYFKENFQAKIYPLEPANSPTLSTGHKVGSHRIQGISDDFIPQLLKLKDLDEVVRVDDGDAIIMAQMLCKQLGIAVGISSGANMLGAVLANSKLGGNANVLTVFADDNKKYLSTDYAKEEPSKPDFLTNDIVLLGVRAIR